MGVVAAVEYHALAKLPLVRRRHGPFPVKASALPAMTKVAAGSLSPD